MALDATIAGSASNSYLTAAEADAYAASDPINGDAWLLADAAAKERSLMAATEDVRAYKRGVGLPFAATQALLFPREVDYTGDPAVPFILSNVRRSTYEQAVYLLRNAKPIADAATRRARALFSFSDDDGSGQPALSASFGLYAPKFMEYLDAIGASGRSTRTIVSVPMTSSYE